MPIKHQINIGDEFSRLTVVSQLANDRHGSRRFLCLCKCGNECVVSASSLYRGKTNSCGCLHKERVTRHGHRKSPDKTSSLYVIWCGMKARCNNKTSQSYPFYGGRGITYSATWDEFIPFEQWANTSGYKPGLQLDRTDPNGNYTPENCRWVERFEQDYNKRNTLRYNDKPLKLVCDELGINYGQVWKRIRRDGWSVEKALFTPVRTYSKEN